MSQESDAEQNNCCLQSELRVVMSAGLPPIMFRMFRMKTVAVPILTWHANNVAGNDYPTNDHVKLQDDLETIHRVGRRIVPLADIAKALRAGKLEEMRGCVGLSFDDSPDLDFYDAPHPAWGVQRSMFNIVADFRARHPDASVHATSFAIASQDARIELDSTCLIGCKWWNHEWWPTAEATGVLAIESHSWDHNHETLASTVTSAQRGTFALTSAEDARREIADATRVIRQLRKRDGPVLFAYPYGSTSDYLVTDYFPKRGAEHGVTAAFTGSNGFVRPETSPWAIPRYIAGADWRSPSELELLLGEAPPADRPWGAGTQTGAVERSWRESLRTWEVRPASVVAGELFNRAFGHPVPDYGRHFVLVYSPAPTGRAVEPSIIAYVHWLPFKDVYLGGGMCVDERIYRRMPKAVFAAVRDQGGLATIVTRESIELLGDTSAVFGYVGEPRARQADLRTGFSDTGRPNLMVIWRKSLTEGARTKILDEVAALGPF